MFQIQGRLYLVVGSSQTNPREINVTKSFDNGKVLTLDHRSMSDEPLPRNQFGQD